MVLGSGVLFMRFTTTHLAAEKTLFVPPFFRSDSTHGKVVVYQLFTVKVVKPIRHRRRADFALRALSLNAILSDDLNSDPTYQPVPSGFIVFVGRPIDVRAFRRAASCNV